MWLQSLSPQIYLSLALNTCCAQAFSEILFNETRLALVAATRRAATTTSDLCDDSSVRAVVASDTELLLLQWRTTDGSHCVPILFKVVQLAVVSLDSCTHTIQATCYKEHHQGVRHHTSQSRQNLDCAQQGACQWYDVSGFDVVVILLLLLSNHGIAADDGIESWCCC